jgi:hypothetical protein
VPETGHGIRDDSIVTVSCQSLQWYWLQLVLNDANHRRQDTSPIDWNYLVAFSAVPIRYGIPGEAMVITALAKAAEAGTGAPETRENAFFGFYGPRLEYLDHREFPHMWSTYPRERRDAIVGAFLAEYDGWIRKLGRDYFVKVTGEIDPADRDNTPGPPMAPPWIRSHAGVTAYFKDRKYPAEIQARMRDLGSVLWPDAAPGWR